MSAGGAVTVLRPLHARDRVRIPAMVDATGIFRPDEVAVALEVFDGAVADPSGDYRSIGTYEDDRLVGFALYGPTPCTVGTWDLYWIVVDPAAQRSGLGKLLVPSARDTLIRSLQDAEHPKVRRAVAGALGGYLRDELAASALIKKIEDAVLSLAPASVAAGDLKGEIQKGKDKAVMRANAAHKILQKDLNSLFQSNPRFGFEFIYEAMTGEVKFGGNLGTCTHFLTCEFDGDNAHLIPVTNEQYVRKILKRTKVSVRFKTTSQKTGGKKTGAYKYWSVVGLVTNKLLEEIESAGDLLTEGILSNIIQKVKDFAMRTWNKVKEWVSKSWQNLLDFLGFEPVVSFQNNISFQP